MLTVRTKADPPTSATRERMEGWGRPVRWVFLFLSHFLVECGFLVIGNVFADYYFLGGLQSVPGGEGQEEVWVA